MTLDTSFCDVARFASRTKHSGETLEIVGHVGTQTRTPTPISPATGGTHTRDQPPNTTHSNPHAPRHWTPWPWPPPPSEFARLVRDCCVRDCCRETAVAKPSRPRRFARAKSTDRAGAARTREMRDRAGAGGRGDRAGAARTRCAAARMGGLRDRAGTTRTWHRHQHRH